jgi:hypothetical protein
MNYLQYLEDLSKNIDEKHKTNLKNKESFAEVSTPYQLRKDMLDKVPNKIWSNKKIKCFEPSSGKGGFLVDIILRFMNGLKKKIKNEKKRYKYIVENIIYFADINEKNVKINCKLLDPNDEFRLNYYIGSSLDLDIEKKFNVSQFDIVIGNPPYNDDTGATGRGHQLWVKFVDRALNYWLKPKGLLVYVHPSGWRNVEGDGGELLKSKRFLYLEIHNEKDGQKIFKCNTRYDWYVLINEDNKNRKTKIMGENGKLYRVNIQNQPFIPNFNIPQILKMIAKKEKDRFTILYSRSAYGANKRWVNMNKTSKFKYPVVYSINRQNKPTFFYADTNKNGFFKIPKVIFASGATGFILDENGKYGCTNFAKGMVVAKKELKRLYKWVFTEKFKILENALSISFREINYKAMGLLNKNFWKIK